MRITADGQVTIPAELRAALGLEPDTEVRFEIDGDALRIRRADASASPPPPLSVEPYPGKGAALVAFTWGKATTDLTTEEIMEIFRGED